jgi:hypothetical protein
MLSITTWLPPHPYGAPSVAGMLLAGGRTPLLLHVAGGEGGRGLSGIGNSTGSDGMSNLLPEAGASEGAPWLMSAGTAAAHIMINPPKN